MALALAAAPARAQTHGGLQGGLSTGPNQIYVGAHLETAPLIDELRFRPNADVGFGDHQTLVALNFDFKYMFPARRNWNVYAGAGPAMNFYRFSGGGSSTGGGFNMFLGAQESHGLFFEAKIGAWNSPNFKFGVGYTMR